MSDDEKTEQESQVAGEARLTWHGMGDAPRYFANQMSVQHTDSEFILSFFQLFPPLLMGSAEEQQRQLESMPEVKAQCVTQVIVPLETMAGVVTALQENLKKSQRRRAAVAKAKEQGEETQ